MEQLMSDLLRQIAEKMGNLVEVVDEDYGQLDALKNGEPVYPVAFPCVLVGIPETVWGNLKADTQRGEPTLSVRLAFDCGVQPPVDESTAVELATQRYQLVKRLNDAVQGWGFEGCRSAAVRTKSVQTVEPGNVKVYEQQYAVMVIEREVRTA